MLMSDEEFATLGALVEKSRANVNTWVEIDRKATEGLFVARGEFRELSEKLAHARGERTPVDRTAVTLTDGSPVPADGNHREDRGDGQQRGYVVLSAAERAKGFVRPIRRSYVHQKCGTLTTMSQEIAETYARSPTNFYTGTFCCGCGKHFPVGADGEFVWDGTDEKVGT